ncbi:MAG: hypothetical protein CL680_02010 [Blastomonas sp.]|jgi:hypothetical protein|nr:hypothetical protein [Blastomonas sp.]|tara:strand:+ start:114273 stop:114530 length:258 start_codon:yes stop_codon:yes gene_type:complete
MDGTRVVKLASFARVTHLVQERERLLYALTRDVKIVFDADPWHQVVDQAMIDAVTPAIKPAITAELNRRIGVIDVELVELGMSID